MYIYKYAQEYILEFLCRFQIMKKCWESDSADRPTFSELVTSIDQHVEYLTGYVNLNIPGKGNEAEASTQQKDEEHETKANTGSGTEDKELHVDESMKATAAAEVFKKSFPQVLKAVDVNAPNLAAAFYAEGVISDDVLEEFYSNTSKNQTLKLLHSVLKIIETHPEYFSKVCTALEQDYASTAKSLKDEFKSYLEQLTKDKANGETSKSTQAEN